MSNADSIEFCSVFSSAKVATPPSLVLSGSGFTPRKAEKLDAAGGDPSPAATGPLGFAQKSSGQLSFTQKKSAGPLDDIAHIANRWSTVFLAFVLLCTKV